MADGVVICGHRYGGMQDRFLAPESNALPVRQTHRYDAPPRLSGGEVEFAL